MTYREYLTSEKWRKRKQDYYETHERKCRACNSRKRIHLHHKTYRRLGCERDQDLVPLCHACHSTLHRLQKKTGQNLWLATEDFIRRKKKRYKTKQLVKRRKVTKKAAARRR